MSAYPATCIHCNAQAYWEGLYLPGSNAIPQTWCPTSGCPSFHPHAYVQEMARITFGGGGVPPIPSGPPPVQWYPGSLELVPVGPPKPEAALYETSAEEKRVAGQEIKTRDSIMEAWDRLEKKGFMLARRTQEEKK